MEIQLAMVVLEVRDLDASIRFYRRLGLDVPDGNVVLFTSDEAARPEHTTAETP